MQRLSDHFKYMLPGDGAISPSTDARALPAEDPSGRPPLQRARFGGLPIWFHAPGTSQNGTLLRADGGALFDPDDAIACMQYEHYAAAEDDAARDDTSRLKSLYYFLKPIMPRALQLKLQRVNARRRLRTVRFPSWPQDSTLTDLLGRLLATRLRDAGLDSVPFLGFWPNGMTWAWSLTHDVDTAVGYAHVEPMAQAEEARGVRSCWYFVPERYPLDRAYLEALRHRGYEIGVHGLEHSGRLFSSRREFEWRRDRINRYLHDWNAVGFRSPATYRNPYWLPELDVDYDSSYMDNATLEPQRGGVCAAFPFMLSERLVELPITLPMDHTLLNILRQDVLEGCRAKATWVRDQHGLALALFHPDYNTSRDRVDRYGALIEHLRETPHGWYALPWQIADWWQRRRHSHVVLRDGRPSIEGPAAGDGCIWHAHRDGDRLVLDPPATPRSPSGRAVEDRRMAADSTGRTVEAVPEE